ncbi:hypothetical protein EFK50_05240 [Nocardioides marmoriginsengisoli]|uniref:Uncharacterized protein n=1 Tax=Nocardioides marmoriginsengisoli TaxID=661483 RepID=A0A3N0CPG2_9ACTN|nr:hypothetical protein [Nocardioides marmoriginsengisoli]RNL65364.1 hypothetical protein EFK50_05240 [Nocardioides marmoriginsengisoli]
MLNLALRLDVLASGGLGLLLLVLTGPAEDELGMPVGFTVGAALVMIGWAGFVAWVSARPSRGLVTEVVALNLVYVAASVLVAVSGWVDLTDLGVAFVLLQGLAVLGLTVWQFLGLRTGDPVAA